MTWWPLGRNRQPAAAPAHADPAHADPAHADPAHADPAHADPAHVGPANATPPVIGSAEPDGAWQDLPALQRTLADSLSPVAINDDFRDSLSSYADPSFVAPLSHHVDPQAG